MRCYSRPLALGASLILLTWTAARSAPPPAAPAALRTQVFTTKRELFGKIWGAGNWIAFGVDEDQKDLNNDGDSDDTILALLDLRTLQVQETGLAIDTGMVDETEDWLVAFSGKDALIAIQVSEEDQGKRDLNGNGVTTDSVLALYNPLTRQSTNLGVTGKYPTFLNGKLYFVQPEAIAKRDLNGDGDMADSVLCVYDPATKQTSSLQMDASGGFKVAGDWIAALASEAGQGNKDLNGDGDTGDVVVQLYQVSTGKWTSTGLEGSAGMEITPKLVAIAVEEAKQGAKDLNGDGDTMDTVCEVWDLAAGKAQNLGMDCSEGLAADGDLVGFVTNEASQGAKDLNGDGDTQDAVVQAFSLEKGKTVNVSRDGTGGLVAASGKLAFACSEEDNGKKDLNGDGDTDDFVLMVYDPVKNNVLNTRMAIDGDPVAGEGYLAWKVLEADQGNRDLNRDKDTDDSVLFVMDLSTGAFANTGYACGDAIAPTALGIGFSTFEADQGERDINMDGDTDDEILQVARILK
jgi:hypothetical protein